MVVQRAPQYYRLGSNVDGADATDGGRRFVVARRCRQCSRAIGPHGRLGSGGGGIARGGRLVANWTAIVSVRMRLEQNDGGGRRRDCCCDVDKETDRFETVGAVGVYRIGRQMLGAWVVGRPMMMGLGAMVWVGPLEDGCSSLDELREGPSANLPVGSVLGGRPALTCTAECALGGGSTNARKNAVGNYLGRFGNPIKCWAEMRCDSCGQAALDSTFAIEVGRKKVKRETASIGPKRPRKVES